MRRALYSTLTVMSHDAPTERFSSRVEDYVRHRPSYPPQVLEILRREIRLSPAWAIADIGSGTGISSALFLQNGNTVYAIEPNDAMRAAAEKRLGVFDAFHSISGTAEATTLAEDSIDLIVCAQAFHWFDPAAARAEMGRILKPGGAVALLWNTRCKSGSAFLEAYEQLLHDFGTDYRGVQHENITEARIRSFFGGVYLGRYVCPNHQPLDRAGLEGRLMSSSYIPNRGHPRHAAMIERLEAIFTAHAVSGTVAMDYETELYLSRGIRADCADS